MELVAIVANPTYRSAAFTQAFDREEGLDTVPNWRYLTGSLSQLSQVWQQYGITVENLPAGAMSAHNDLAVVIDRTGHIREEVNTDPGPATVSTKSSFSVLLSQYARQALATREAAMRRGRPARGPARGLRGLIALAAGCGSQTAPVTTPALRVQTAPLSTSLVTPQGSWAVTVMGGSAADENNFWQLFVRPAGATRWSLVTPEGVADNGGLVAAAGADGTSLVVGFRPSQGLAFSPLATSSDTGKTWTPGLLDADLADVPDAMAVAPSGQTLALLQRRRHRGSAERRGGDRRAVVAADHAVRPGGVGPGTRVRAGGGERGFVRPR